MFKVSYNLGPLSLNYDVPASRVPACLILLYRHAAAGRPVSHVTIKRVYNN